MRISREFNHRAYADNEFVREETVELEFEIADRRGALTVNQEVRPVGEEGRTMQTLKAEELAIEDVERICETMSEWCRRRDPNEMRFRTGYVEGKWKTDDGETSIEQLSLCLNHDGLNIKAITEQQSLGAVRIPSRTESTDDTETPPEHLHTLNTLLNLARIWSDGGETNPGPALDAGGEFTGPIHASIENLCISDYYENEEASAIATAGQELEREMKRQLGAHEDRSAGDLVGMVLGEDSPRLVASQDPDQQQGVFFLFRGAISALRNPLTHRDPSPDDDQFPDRVTRRFARDALYFFDLLFLILDEELEDVEQSGS